MKIKRILSLIFAMLFVFPIFSLQGCNQQESNVLRICNCEDYIDESLLEEFTEETGIEVIYSTYGTNENLYNELVINPNSYDLVVPSEYMIQNLAAEGRLNKLDLSKVPSYTPSGYIDERLGDILFTVSDGEYQDQTVKLSDFMVGYMWGTMGWVYNTDEVAVEDVSSWGNVFKNKDLNKKATIKDAVRDSYLVGLAMVYEEDLRNATTTEEITEILNRVDKESIDKVGKKLNSIKPMLYGFEVDSGKNDIVLGKINAYVAWSGDAAYAIDVASGEVEDDDGTFVENVRNLSYYIPDEGSNIWFDGFCMPSGSDNYEAVYKFLNFISRPENVIRNMDYTGYTSLVASDEIFEEIVIGWFDESEDLAENEGIEVDLSYFFGDGEYKVKVSEDYYGRLLAQYPTKKIAERCAIMNYFTGETLMDINEMWEGVKGEVFSWGFIFGTLFIVLLVVVLVLLYRFRHKITIFNKFEREKDYAKKHNLKVIKKENIL